MKSHLHFMGIAGIGMSGLARWYHADGYRVSGCDLQIGSAAETLRSLGIEVAQGHSPDHLDGVDRLVYSTAVAADHPERRAATARSLPSQRRIELLAELLGRKAGVTVTGTHGKSTTTGMIAQIFVGQDDDPSVLVGADLPAIGGNVRYGSGPRLIAEVDESDPGFAALPSELAVLTNLEDDHVAGSFEERRNYHASLAALEEATLRFARNATRVLYCADWARLHELLGELPNAQSYGFDDDATYRIEAVAGRAEGSSFTLHTPDGERYPASLTVPGRYNVQNAAAALASAHLCGLDVGAASAELARFGGVGRRWQRRGSVRDALVIDDYAHHPTEVALTLEAARDTGRRVRAVLQPHRWIRTARHWPALADAARLADEVIVLDIYGAGETPIEDVSPDLIVDRLVGHGVHAHYRTMPDATRYLCDTLRPNDLVLTLGAGDVWKVARDVVATAGGDDGSA
ncbi:MAG: UDP-N-acetylmuramate--L-alanine ligase [Trueperaceae bacterium]|nr:UDP-N-acetylmuramate--L-alanine ligase [Trueperaceae bacterium]